MWAQIEVSLARHHSFEPLHHEIGSTQELIIAQVQSSVEHGGETDEDYGKHILNLYFD
jgi:hypothetical protein